MSKTMQNLADEVSVQLSVSDLVILSAELEKLSEALLADGAHNQPLVQALWNLECSIEKASAQILSAEFNELLAQARERNRENFDGDKSH